MANKERIEAEAVSMTAPSNMDEKVRQCLKTVKSLNLASMTPMEAMLFLNGLQELLKDVNFSFQT